MLQPACSKIGHAQNFVVPTCCLLAFFRAPETFEGSELNVTSMCPHHPAITLIPLELFKLSLVSKLAGSI